MNNDGKLDMITGQYHPGDVTWFKGSKSGFEPGINLEQEGDPAANVSPEFHPDAPKDPITHFSYWNYSTASFGDIDRDGDLDLFVGGKSLRYSENMGTPEKPKFGRRKALLGLDEEPLKVTGGLKPRSTFKWSPYVVDWDNDGVIDLLATDDYRNSECMAVAFFRGVQTEKGLRFEPAIDLLKTVGNKKALPGSGQRVCVADWNADGINDLIVGASVATVSNGKFSDELSWEWEDVTKVQSAGKDPGRYPPREKPTLESMKAQFGDRITGDRLDKMYKMNLDYWEKTIGVLYKEKKEHWLTLRHQGRIYVFLGKTNKGKSKVDQVEPNSNRRTDRLPAKSSNKQNPNSPVKISVDSVIASGKKKVQVDVDFSIKQGWYIYAPTGKNTPQKMTETSVTFDLPKGWKVVGNPLFPIHFPKGSFDVIELPLATVSQDVQPPVDAKPGKHKFTVSVTYQTCNKDGCFLPATVKIDSIFVVKDKQ